MKIANRSQLSVDEAVWRDAAEALQLDGFDTGQGRRTNELRVIVGVPRQPSSDQSSLNGFHTPNEIVILTCRKCTSGTVFLTYLHELMHQWLHQKHPDLYQEDWTELLCEGVARAGFGAFGGTILPRRTCDRWQLPNPLPTVQETSGFKNITDDLLRSSPRQLKEMARTLASSHDC